MLCTGRLPWTYDRRDLRLARYKMRAIQTPTRTNNRAKLPANIGMMGNDREGCCVVAEMGHYVMGLTSMTGKTVTIPDQVIHDTYRHLTGGPDTGLNMRSFQNYLRTTGLGGHRSSAWVACETRDPTELQESCYVFRGCRIGVNLPANYADLSTWADPNPSRRPDPSLGHCVGLLDYDKDKKLFWGTTWARIIPISVAWVMRYVEEAQATLLPEQIDLKTGKDPVNNLNVRLLMADLKEIGA